MKRAYRWTPEGLAKRRELNRNLHADPEFAKAHAERTAERMREIWRKAKGAA